MVQPSTALSFFTPASVKVDHCENPELLLESEGMLLGPADTPTVVQNETPPLKAPPPYDKKARPQETELVQAHFLFAVNSSKFCKTDSSWKSIPQFKLLFADV